MEETHLKGDSSAADTEELNIKNGVDKTSSNENGKEHIRSSQDYIKGNDSFTLKVLKTMALYLAYVGMASTLSCIYPLWKGRMLTCYEYSPTGKLLYIFYFQII